MRKRYDGNFTALVALEAIRGERTLAEIASVYGVRPNQISKWKKQALDELPKLFSGRHGKKEAQAKELTDLLYQEIGRLKVELDWLKKSWTYQLISCVSQWISTTRIFRCADSVSCWDLPGRASITSRGGLTVRMII
jgi:transposase-like protein